MLIATSAAMLSVVGCTPGEAPLPRPTADQMAAAKGVKLTSVAISEHQLTATAENGGARVALTLTLRPGQPNPWLERLIMWAMGTWEPERDGARPCDVRVLDRDGELMMTAASTIGVTDTRTLEDFEADLKVAEGLAAQLSLNQQAWNLYRWELRNIGYTAHELHGLRGPTQ
jgi:hypothetical protein